MSIKQFIQEKEKGLKSPVYFLYAEDLYILNEASMLVSEMIPESERGFCLHVFDFDDIDETIPVEHIADILRTVPFMGSRRIVILKNIQELDKKDIQRLEAYITEPVSCSVLVLLYKGNPLKGPFKDFAGKVKTVSLDIRPQDFPLWIKEKAQKKGLTLTDKAIACLLEAVGPDAGMISSEIEKIALLGKRNMDAGDIKDIVSSSIGYGAFDLVNAIKSKDPEKVFKIARRLMETTEPYALLGAINWHYSRLASADSKREGHFNRIFDVLHQADLNIKTSGGNYPIEHLLIRLLKS